MNVKVVGMLPVEDTRIRDMMPGQTGYTVPWAYDRVSNKLDPDFTISDKGGTASMRVTCKSIGEYEIEFENPVYRSGF